MNVSIVGSAGLAAKLGKKGTSSDIALYNTSFQRRHFTFVEPVTYPEKIQTMFQCINMSQLAVLHMTSQTPKNVLGECIIAVDMLKKPGIIVLDSFDEPEMKKFISGTSLESFPIMTADAAGIMAALSDIVPEGISGKTKVVIDHSFDVKSVGAIALGTVVSGEVKKHDSLRVYPSGKDIVIKSIQIHDKDADKGSCHDRIGLAVKGAEISDLQRGSVISDSMECVREIDIVFHKNKFFKDDVPKSVMCVVGLQYVNAVIEGDRLTFGREIAFDGEEIIILAPDKKMRIVGIARRRETQ